jgi:hypothetical protein
LGGLSGLDAALGAALGVDHRGVMSPWCGGVVGDTEGGEPGEVHGGGQQVEVGFCFWCARRRVGGRAGGASGD